MGHQVVVFFRGGEEEEVDLGIDRCHDDVPRLLSIVYDHILWWSLERGVSNKTTAAAEV